MSKEFEPISLGELRKTNIPTLIEKRINIHQVPLFTGPTIDEQIGSGTLVSFGNTKGILTAAHVIAKLVQQKQNVIYVPYIPKPNGTLDIGPVPFGKDLLITIDNLNDVASYLGWRKTWLDIALLRLNTDTYEKLIAIGKKPADLQASYIQYNTDKQKYGSNENLEWLGVMHGCPGEKENSPEINPNRIELFYSGSYIGGPEYETVQNKLDVIIRDYNKIPDLISMTIKSTTDRLPRDFEGASGGAFWKTALHKDKNGNIKIDELFLGGVFVCATQNKKRTLKLFCRGPKSLYDVFCNFLITKVENT
jgi:hypothetical protein